MTDRRRQSASGRPTGLNPAFQGSGDESAQPFPLRDGVTLPLMFENVAGPLVIRLLVRICPTAILRLVVAFVVDAIERMPERAWSHIAQERIKVVAPFRAHGDSAPAVVVVARLLGVIAPSFGSTPRAVLPRALDALTTISRLPVFQLAFGAALDMEAPATAREAASQARTDHRFYLSARAPTAPCGSLSKAQFAWCAI